MTNSINEILNSELIFLIGSNATEAHPIIGNKMKETVRKNGTKLIVIDPRRIELAEMADYWLPLNSGTDVALINAMMNVIIENKWYDEKFVKSRTSGFEELKEVVSDYTPDSVSRLTGIPAETIVEVAELYAKTNKAGIFYTLGITEHTTGTENVMTLANLAMLTGHLGKESSGINPMRGQNNVQGACDMGALPNTYPGYQKVNDENAAKFFSETWGVNVSKDIGLMIPEMFDESIAGNLKAMYVMGEDPVLSDPDANHVKKAFESLDFFVVQDIFLSETAKFADVVFPAACYAEKNGTFTNTERRVQRVRKAVNAPGEARGDWEILAEVARRIGGIGFDYKNSEEVFNEIALTTPSYRGMDYRRIDKEGLQWPCPTKEHPGTKFLHEGAFPNGRAKMMPAVYKEPAELVDEEYPMLLSTGRMLYHYNITTRFSDALDTIRPYELAELNPEDAERMDMVDGEIVKVSSRRGEILTRIVITDKVKPGMMFMTFHYRESPVNEITNPAHDPITKTAEYKIAAVKVEKVSEEEARQLA